MTDVLLVRLRLFFVAILFRIYPLSGLMSVYLLSQLHQGITQCYSSIITAWIKIKCFLITPTGFAKNKQNYACER